MPVNFTRLELSNSSIIRVFLWALFFYGLYFFRELILILFLSIIIASVNDRIVVFFSKIKFSRMASVLTIYILMILFIIIGFYFLIPTISAYISIFIQKIPDILNSLKIFSNNFVFLQNYSNYLNEISQNISQEKIFEYFKSAVFGGTSSIISGAGIVIGGLVKFVLVIVLSFYLSLEERSVQKFLRLVSVKKYEDYIIDLWDRSQAKIVSWFTGLLTVALIMSILVYILLSVLNIPFAPIIAIIAFFGQLIPVVGLSISTFISAIIAFATGGVNLLIITIIAFFILSQIENTFLTPKIIGNAVGMPTVIVILSLLIGGTIAGFWGILIAIPVSSFFVELLTDFDKKKKKEWEDVY